MGCHKDLYYRAYFIFDIHQLFRGRGNRQNIENLQMTLNYLEKLRKLEINKIYKMTLIN